MASMTRLDIIIGIEKISGVVKDRRGNLFHESFKSTEKWKLGN